LWPDQPASPSGLILILAVAPVSSDTGGRPSKPRSLLTLPVELEGVAPQPAGAARSSLGLGELASLAQSSG